MKANTCAAGLALLLLLGCGSGHRSTPTGPQSQLVATILLDTFSSGSVLAATVSLDGHEIGRSDWGTVGGCIGTCLVQGAQDSLPAPGPHTVTVTILRQTVDIIDYDFRGSVFLSEPAGTGSIPLPLQTKKLMAGGSVTYDFST